MFVDILILLLLEWLFGEDDKPQRNKNKQARADEYLAMHYALKDDKRKQDKVNANEKQRISEEIDDLYGLVEDAEDEDELEDLQDEIDELREEYDDNF